MKLARLPLLLALIALLLLAVSGLGVRASAWPFPVGFSVLRWAAYLGIAAGCAAFQAPWRWHS